MAHFSIGERTVGEMAEPFLIAEVGINHNGDMEIAKRMILAAKEAGVDAVKFQTFYADEFITDRTEMYTYYSQGKEITEPMIDMFKRTEFSKEQWEEIAFFCNENNVVFLSTPGNVSDLELLVSVGVKAIKIGSDDFVNIPLVKRYAREEMPLLLSCGMATEKEIEKSLEAAGTKKGKKVALFLCTSEYPTPPEDVNVLKLCKMKERFPEVVLGLSDHTQGCTAAIMAVAMGARIFEKHFTLDHNMSGPDHWFSEEPMELKRWVDEIRKAYRMLGSDELQPTEKEIQMRKICHRSITASANIACGDTLSEENLCMRRPGTGLTGEYWEKIIGKNTTRFIKKGEQLCKGDIEFD